MSELAVRYHYYTATAVNHQMGGDKNWQKIR